jgi:hypothetical protein
MVFSRTSHISTILSAHNLHVTWLVTLSARITKISATAKTPIRHDLPFAMTSEADEEGIDLFQEPADFYEPEKQPSFASHQLLSGQEVTVRLVGHNPLWVGHLKYHSDCPLRRFLTPSIFTARS